MTAAAVRFRATLLSHGKIATGFFVPDRVVEALGPGKRHRVRVTIGTHEYRSSIAVMGGCFMLGVSATDRAASGVQGCCWTASSKPRPRQGGPGGLRARRLEPAPLRRAPPLHAGVPGHGRSLLLDRGTYDSFSAYWPTVTDPDDTIAVAINGLHKYVPSSTLTDPAWGPTTVLRGDLAQDIASRKARGGQDILFVGSARLASSLVAQDLVDEYRLWIHPVALGTGKKLFPSARPRSGCGSWTPGRPRTGSRS